MEEKLLVIQEELQKLLDDRPEADTMTMIDGELYVAMENLDAAIWQWINS